VTTPPEPTEHQPTPPSGGKRPVRLTAGQVSGAILLILALIFVFENTKKVDVRLIGPQVHAPLFVALLIAAVLGALGALLIQWRRRGRRRN
jgi:uncharacterized integral membrane protein